MYWTQKSNFSRVLLFTLICQKIQVRIIIFELLESEFELSEVSSNSSNIPSIFKECEHICPHSGTPAWWIYRKVYMKYREITHSIGDHNNCENVTNVIVHTINCVQNTTKVSLKIYCSLLSIFLMLTSSIFLQQYSVQCLSLQDSGRSD